MDSGRLPSLDGLRAVSISLVMLAHLQATKTVPLLAYLWWVDFGNLGVRVFFVISGFLITSLLLEEQKKYGRISLRRFYLRRALRIFPAYYAFLTLVLMASTMKLTDIPGRDFLAAATYTSNYFVNAWTLGHTWSLSVEEQFYFLWPSVLVLAGTKRGLWIAAGLFVLAPVIRTAAVLSDSWPVNPRYAFETVGDALATGCLLAGLRGWLWDRRAYRTFLTSKFVLLIPIALVLVQFSWAYPAVRACLGITLLNTAIATGIDWCLRFADSPLGRVLNSKPFVFVGALSYSLYLWQNPFLEPEHSIAFPFNLGLALCAALVSYFLIEKPILRMRSMIENRLFGRRQMGDAVVRA